MKVVILCGGRGTRMREESEFRPKPMVTIGDRPILWHIMKTYAHFGHREFILCLGYRGSIIKEYFRNYRWHLGDVTLSLAPDSKPRFDGPQAEDDWTVTLAETGEDAMTGCRVKRIERYIPKGEAFLLTYGDGLAAIDIAASVRSHRQAGKICTLTAVHPSGRYGAIRIDEEGGIHDFVEKPQFEEAYVNGGYMVCDHRFFDYLSDDPGLIMEGAPLAALVRDRQLHSYRHEGFWQPMDTPKENQFLNELWSTGKAPWKVW